MPGVVLHRLLAARAIYRPRDASRSADAKGLQASPTLEAFLQGAIAPDMGYFLPGAAWISDLAHTERTADLARALVQAARSPVERAYAWGWVTHCLADVAIHPLINRAAALARGGTASALSARDDLGQHLRVELGLDSVWRSEAPRPTGRPALRPAQLDFVSAAFREVHGVRAEPTLLHAAHTAAARLEPWLHALVGAIRLAHRVTPRPAPARAAQPGARGGSRTGAFVIAAFTALPPPLALADAVRDEVERFQAVFRGHRSTGLRDLENRDLDTGAPLEPARTREVA